MFIPTPLPQSCCLTKITGDLSNMIFFVKNDKQIEDNLIKNNLLNTFIDDKYETKYTFRKVTAALKSFSDEIFESNDEDINQILY